jgi:hypothetical protein
VTLDQFRRAAILAALTVVCLATTACGDCAGVGSPAVDVTVRDAETGTGAASGTVIYLFKQPSIQPVDSVVGTDSLHLYAGWDQSGTFDVVLEKRGYYPWTIENVDVKEDCGTHTAFLIARLRRRAP